MSDTDTPTGPRKVLQQALEAGFEASVEAGQNGEARAWLVTGEKGSRGFSALWSQASPEAGVRSLGIFSWGEDRIAVPLKLTELRTWLERAE